MLLLHLALQATGPHIYEVQPSANWFDCKSMAIGARSQSARTYLEREMTSISESGGINLCIFIFSLYLILTIKEQQNYSKKN